jgi:hypothetical protein
MLMVHLKVYFGGQQQIKLRLIKYNIHHAVTRLNSLVSCVKSTLVREVCAVKPVVGTG